jgi:DUF1009 family protein
METLGLIAGGGQFPILIAQSYKQATGGRIAAVGFEGETAHDIEQYVDSLTLIPVGKLGGLIETLKTGGVQKAVMAGRVRHSLMFDDPRSLGFDTRGMRLFSSLKDRRADAILGAVAAELKAEGIELMDSTAFVSDLLPEKGVLTKSRPEEHELVDIELGKRLALELGRLDIGQTVIVKNGSVLAVEAMEGSDECIRRGGIIAKRGSVVVKMAKPQQDMRFDVPVIGVTTIETMHEVSARVLAIREGATIIIDQDHVVRKADKHGICIVVV